MRGCWGVVAFDEAQRICLSFFGSEEEIRIGSEEKERERGKGEQADFIGGGQNGQNYAYSEPLAITSPITLAASSPVTK